MDPTTAMYVAQGLHGLAYGMVLFLIASGLNVIFGMMGVLNLAHASFFMLSAYLGFQFVSLTGNFWLALLLAPLVTAICGVLMERFLLTKVHAFGHMGELILTVGVAQIVLAAVKGIWGTESLPLKMPPILEGRVQWAGLDYPIYRLFIIGLALAILMIMSLLLVQDAFGQDRPGGRIRRRHGQCPGHQHSPRSSCWSSASGSGWPASPAWPSRRS